MNLLNHSQMTLHSPQTTIVKQHLAVQLANAILQFFEKFDALHETIAQLFFRHIYASMDVRQLRVIAHHDTQLALVRLAQIGQNRRIAQITGSILILLECRGDLALLFDQLVCVAHQHIKSLEASNHTTDFAYAFLLRLVYGRLDVDFELPQYAAVEHIDCFATIGGDVLQRCLRIFSGQPLEQCHRSVAATAAFRFDAGRLMIDGHHEDIVVGIVRRRRNQRVLSVVEQIAETGE